MNRIMSDAEAIDTVTYGGRCHTQFTRRDQGPACPGFNHSWRVVACDGQQDVVECLRCGAQEIRECNFNEDVA